MSPAAAERQAVIYLHETAVVQATVLRAGVDLGTRDDPERFGCQGSTLKTQGFLRKGSSLHTRANVCRQVTELKLLSHELQKLGTNRQAVW